MYQDRTIRTPDHPIDAMFVKRHSPRALSSRTLTEGDVLALLEAGRWAPSSMNGQPWRFIYALRGDAGFDAIVSAMIPFNQTWAGRAAALVVVTSVTTMTDKDGNVGPNPTAAYDAGAASFSVALQAHLNGLVAHQMTGYDAEALAQAVALPEGHQLNAIMALGYSGDKADLPDYMHAGETPNARKPLAELARRGASGR